MDQVSPAGAYGPAVAFALAHESPWPLDIGAHIAGGFFEPPPDNAILGPVERAARRTG